MNALLQAPPANPLLEFSSDDPVVAVRILLPEWPWTALVYPGENRVATKLLKATLQDRINATGAGVRSALAVLPFNRSFYISTLSSRAAGPALQAIHDEMSTLGLLSFTQIAWHDPREGVFRTVHPVGSTIAIPTEGEREAESRLTRELLRAVLRVSASEQK
jgi:hypothetical protein